MNLRKLVRNQGRIPRILFHIKRCKGDVKKVKGYEAELHRRCLQMELGGYKDLCNKLLHVKLDKYTQVPLPTCDEIEKYKAGQAAAALAAKVAQAEVFLAEQASG